MYSDKLLNLSQTWIHLITIRKLCETFVFLHEKKHCFSVSSSWLIVPGLSTDGSYPQQRWFEDT